MVLKNRLAVLLLLIAQAGFSQKLIVPTNDRLAYMGRVDVKNDKTEMYWPGTSVTLNFKGTDVKVVLQTKGNAYFYAIVDHDEAKAIKIHPDSARKTYPIASGLAKGKHTVQLVKLTDNTTINSFYGFELNDKAKVLKPQKAKKRKIEFYGNSITAGHGVDVPMGQPDSGAPINFNNYWTYGARTARHFDTQYSCIARSGIGLMVSWFPAIMPEIYNRINPNDPGSHWEFSRYQPDVVVINLCQNDQWLVNQPDHEQFKARFGTTKPDEQTIIKAYQDFLTSIRKAYPNASIICALGNMGITQSGSPWPGYVDKAVHDFGDAKIYTHFFAYKNTPGHPKAPEQKAMADDLIKFIDEHITW